MSASPVTGRRLGLRPGDVVVIRPEHEIRATLDRNGTLEALPFMPEMAQHCGKRARVFRRVEKVWDMRGGTGLRRLRDAVLLTELRCDGGAHDGCQAGCYLLWKEAWLERADGVPPGAADVEDRRAPSDPSRALLAMDLHALTRRVMPEGVRYVCQATELPEASSPMAQGDPRHYVRELVVGNVGLGAFLRGAAIAAFNWVQRWRGGAGFPQLVPAGGPGLPQAPLNLRPGEEVIVRTKREIEATLDERMRNRGLFFDLDMLRYCGGRYRVKLRVERLIDERTARMVTVRAPCVVLEGVVATGEYHAFRAQSEYILWREAWLRRPDDAADRPRDRPEAEDDASPAG